ncbi:MAG: alpha/beta hydrolase [Octadecabacter sp.]|nr:alpha/beta hydrolase [Octadecabacter sp.]
MVTRILTALSAAAVLGAAMITDRQSGNRVSRAEANYPPEGQFLTVDGRQVHAVVDGSGPDLVLIHGAGGNTREFTFSFMHRLTDRYRVIVFDRPGLGYTDRIDDRYDRLFTTQAESPAEQAALLQAAAMQLGSERPIVLGHSYGGSVALAWGLNHPDNAAGIVNLAGPSHPWPGNLGAYYWVNGSVIGGAVVPPMIAAFASEARIEEAITSIFTPQAVPDGYADHIGAPLTVRPDSFRANTRQVNTLRPHVVAMSERYGREWTLPLEIIHGDQDTTVPLAIHSIPLSEAIAHARLTVLEGVGHMPHHAAPDVVEAAIDRIAAQAGLR